MISLLPWSKAASAVDAIEAGGGVEELRNARAALAALAERQSIPGVKKKLAELEDRFVPARDRIFTSLLERGDVDGALRVHEEFARSVTRVEERIRLAAAAMAAGTTPPTLANISGADVKWEWRAAYFDARSREAERAGDQAVMREMLSLWIQHAPEDAEPHARITRSYILGGELEYALHHLQAQPPPLQESLLVSIIDDEELPATSRAWLALQTSRYADSLRLLDSILAAAPGDEWAIGERVRIAEAQQDWATAKELYARWSGIHPGESWFVRRVSDMALAQGDRAESRARLKDAWILGDLDAGFSLVRRMFEEGDDPTEIESTLDEVATGSLTSAQGIEAGSSYLTLGATQMAADCFRKAFQMDRLCTDTVIARANTYVQGNMEKRIPLLELLIDVGPVRGFPGDPYRLMMAEDLIGEGRSREARPHLEDLVATPLRWKSLVALAQMVMSEPKAAQEQMYRRIEATLSEADKVGRNVWAEMSYTAGVLAESAGLKAEAVQRLEELVAREFEYADAVPRLARLRA